MGCTSPSGTVATSLLVDDFNRLESFCVSLVSSALQLTRFLLTTAVFSSVFSSSTIFSLDEEQLMAADDELDGELELDEADDDELDFMFIELFC